MPFNRLSEIQRRFYDRRHTVLKAAIGFMVLLTVPRLAYQLWRLLLDHGPKAAIDINIFHTWVGSWFAGEQLDRIVLLPATYVMLWPFTGWLSFESSRWLWAFLYFAALVWLSHVVISGAGVKKKRDVLFFAVLFILAIYPTCISIGNGQVALLLLPCALTAVLMGRNMRGDIARELVIAFLFLFSLLKIPLTAPFLLIPLLTQRGALRPIIIAAFGYLVLTYVALSYSNTGPVEIFRQWLHDGSDLAATGGYADVHIWLSRLGLKQYILPVSFIILCVFGFWLYLHRNADVWIHLGVAAIVARLWTYHRLYDDLLILVPVITVFRIAVRGGLSSNERLAADILLAVSWLALLSPGFFLQLPFPVGTIFRSGQVVIWLSLLVFLLYYSGSRERPHPLNPEPA